MPSDNTKRAEPSKWARLEAQRVCDAGGAWTGELVTNIALSLDAAEQRGRESVEAKVRTLAEQLADGDGYIRASFAAEVMRRELLAGAPAAPPPEHPQTADRCVECGLKVGLYGHHRDGCSLAPAAPPEPPCDCGCGADSHNGDDSSMACEVCDCGSYTPPPPSLPPEVRRVLEAAKRWDYFVVRNRDASPTGIQRVDAERGLADAVAAWLAGQGKRP